MFQIMIVSERRELIRRLVSYLEKDKTYELSIVPFSDSTVEQFANIKPDIVCLDTSVFVPYSFIIDELTQFHWKFSLVLIGPAAQLWPHSIPSVHVEYAQLNQEVLLSALTALISTLPSPAETPQNSDPFSKQLIPDIYHIVAIYDAFSNAHNIPEISLPDIVVRMHLPFDSFAVQENGKCLLIMIRKSKLPAGMELSNLLQYVRGNILKRYFILYRGNVHWSVVKAVCASFERYLKYSYFLQGNFVDIAMLSNILPIQHDALQYALVHLLEASLLGKSDTAENLLGALYMRILKPGLDFGAVVYVRWMLNWTIRFQGELTNTILPPEQASVFDTIEEEWNNIQQRLVPVSQQMQNKHLSKVVYSTIVAIFTKFRNNLYLEDMAQTLGVNKIYLSRVIKEQTQKTFNEILKDIQMTASQYYLLHTDESVVKIAQSVGYNDANYFGRAYKKYYGVSPMKMRKNNL